MNTDEKYNGWTNRETWALNLHYSNDQGLYTLTLEHAAGVLQGTPDASDNYLGEQVAEFLRTLHEELSDNDTLRMMREEVGSWWRVDHAEIGASVRESLGSEDMLPTEDDDTDDTD